MSSSSASAWTEKEKSQLLLSVISQRTGTINWGSIQMPGRTTKALKNQWGKYITELKEAAGPDFQPVAEGAEGGNGTPAKGRKKAAARSKASTKKQAAPNKDSDGDSEDGRKKKAPAGQKGHKRAASTEADVESPTKKQMTPATAEDHMDGIAMFIDGVPLMY